MQLNKTVIAEILCVIIFRKSVNLFVIYQYELRLMISSKYIVVYIVTDVAEITNDPSLGYFVMNKRERERERQTNRQPNTQNVRMPYSSPEAYCCFRCLTLSLLHDVLLIRCIPTRRLPITRLGF